MIALPTDSQQEDPLDPERILRVLPDREHETFLAQYRQALEGAYDPAGWKHLRRFLRLWAGRAIAASRPGFYEARDRALAGTGGGMLLDDAIPAVPDRQVSYRPWLDGEALRQMGGLPLDALDVLVRTMARICEDPYDRLFSMAVRDEAPQERMAELGDTGFIQFTVDEAVGLVRVHDLVWLD